METFETMQKRISTRDFAARTVPQELVRKVVNAALYAPTGFKKFSELRLTVVQDPTLLQKIDRACRRVPDVSPLHGAPVLVIVSASTKDDALAHQNAACMVNHMLLAATDAGLANLYVKGICPLLENNEALKNELHLPAGFRPLASAAIGYPKQETAPREKPFNEETTVDYIG